MSSLEQTSHFLRELLLLSHPAQEAQLRTCLPSHTPSSLTLLLISSLSLKVRLTRLASLLLRHSPSSSPSPYSRLLAVLMSVLCRGEMGVLREDKWKRACGPVGTHVAWITVLVQHDGHSSDVTGAVARHRSGYNSSGKVTDVTFQIIKG